MIKSQQQNQRIHIFFMWRWILFSSKCLFSNKWEKNEVFQLDNDLSFIRCNCCCNKWKKKNKRHHSAIAINIYGIAIDSNRHTFSYGSIGSLQVIIQEWDFDWNIGGMYFGVFFSENIFYINYAMGERSIFVSSAIQA